MSKSEMVAEEYGQAQEGLFGNSQFEQFVKLFRVIALGSLGIICQLILCVTSVWPWGDMGRESCMVEGCERVSFACRKEGVGEGIAIDEDGDGESSAGELSNRCELVR
jgi:hypothetical protein